MQKNNAQHLSEHHLRIAKTWALRFGTQMFNYCYPFGILLTFGYSLFNKHLLSESDVAIWLDQVESSFDIVIIFSS